MGLNGGTGPPNTSQSTAPQPLVRRRDGPQDRSARATRRRVSGELEVTASRPSVWPAQSQAVRPERCLAAAAGRPPY